MEILLGTFAFLIVCAVFMFFDMRRGARPARKHSGRESGESGSSSGSWFGGDSGGDCGGGGGD